MKKNLWEILQKSREKARRNCWKAFPENHKEKSPNELWGNFVRVFGRNSSKTFGKKNWKLLLQKPCEISALIEIPGKLDKFRMELWEPIRENPWIEFWEKLLETSGKKLRQKLQEKTSHNEGKAADNCINKLSQTKEITLSTVTFLRKDLFIQFC